MTKEERVKELEGKIVTVCVNNQCPHLKSLGGLHCDRKRSQCHSKRVRKWLDEIKKLEVEDESAGCSSD